MANAEEACVLDSVGVLKLEASRARERTAGDARGFDPHPPKHTTQTTQVEVEFHGAPYLISVATPNDETLVVEVEDAESLARWRSLRDYECQQLGMAEPGAPPELFPARLMCSISRNAARAEELSRRYGLVETQTAISPQPAEASSP